VSTLDSTAGNPLVDPGDPFKQGGLDQEITQELVSQVADRVFAMLLRDLQIEKERWRMTNRRGDRVQGGW
jgi:hypothetical protein